MKKIVPVIMAGGSGERLWPLSRSNHPKQFARIAGEFSLLQQALLRTSNKDMFTPPVLVCNEKHRFIVEDHCREINLQDYEIILEPEQRNTAAAIALAAVMVAERYSEAVMIAMPADHYIGDEKAFAACAQSALNAAEQDKLVTFGIKPEYPATGYGYIKAGEAMNGFNDCFEVEQFLEKPEKEVAEIFIEKGGYYWNGGIFVMRAVKFLEELGKFQPDVLIAARESMEKSSIDGVFLRPDADSFKASPSISIDYAVMEKTDSAAVVPADMNWRDLGTFDSLLETSKQDDKGNAVSGNVMLHEVRSSYIHANGRLMAVMGLDDVLVVDTDDAVLVASREKAGELKDFLGKLKEEGKPELENTKVDFRPWGSFKSISREEHCQVKRLNIKPGGKISLQRHKHRSEHWVVVSGTALVTIGEEVKRLQKNESAFIPAGAMHRLENDGEEMLEIIEVQTGTYLGEDDIERVQDEYGRV